MPQLFVILYRSKRAYMRSFAGLFLLADFGTYPINSQLSVEFQLKNSNLDILEEKFSLKFINLKAPSICIQKMPSFFSAVVVGSSASRLTRSGCRRFAARMCPMAGLSAVHAQRLRS